MTKSQLINHVQDTATARAKYRVKHNKQVTPIKRLTATAMEVAFLGAITNLRTA